MCKKNLNIIIIYVKRIKCFVLTNATVVKITFHQYIQSHSCYKYSENNDTYNNNNNYKIMKKKYVKNYKIFVLYKK